MLRFWLFIAMWLVPLIGGYFLVARAVSGLLPH